MDCDSTMSVSSQSVSFFGEDIDVEVALDKIITQIQSFINDTHVNVRQLIVIPEQDNNYMLALEHYLAIITDIDGMGELFKELKSVAKQILGKPPNELKEQVKTHIDNHKRKKQQAKPP